MLISRKLKFENENQVELKTKQTTNYGANSKGRTQATSVQHSIVRYSATHIFLPKLTRYISAPQEATLIVYWFGSICSDC